MIRIHIRYVILYLSFLALCDCQTSVKKENQPDTVIDVWYGNEQTFGQIGNAQRQINLLGNIKTDREGIHTYYTLNESETKIDLTLGSDLHRLALLYRGQKPRIWPSTETLPRTWR